MDVDTVKNDTIGEIFIPHNHLVWGIFGDEKGGLLTVTGMNTEHSIHFLIMGALDNGEVDGKVTGTIRLRMTISE